MFPSEAQTTSNADNLLLIGDPILIVDPKERQSVANVVKITKSNQSLKEIDSSSSFIDVEFVLRKIDTEEINRNLYWKGTMIQGTFSYPGENCLPIQPSIDLTPPTGMTKVFFRSELVKRYWGAFTIDLSRKRILDNRNTNNIWNI